MESVQAAQTVSQAATALSQDPWLTGLAWIAAIVSSVFALGIPVREYLRGSRQHEEHDEHDLLVGHAKSSAEIVLYNHLVEQITQYRDIADQAFKERNALVDRVARLEEQSTIFQQAQSDNARLRSRLMDRDQEIKTLLEQGAFERREFLNIIQLKDAEIAKRDDRILSLELGQRELEKRLLSDEVRLGCPFHQAQEVVISPPPTL